jgi:hypothetical protein
MVQQEVSLRLGKKSVSCIPYGSTRGLVGAIQFDQLMSSRSWLCVIICVTHVQPFIITVSQKEVILSVKSYRNV